MTKARPPLTIENALDKVIGDLTIEGASDATGRKPGYLRALTDPDKREQLAVADALKLDLASIEAGGGAPIYETLGLILKTSYPLIFSGSVAISDVSGDVIKEGSEAHIALFRASRPNASHRDRIDSIRELEESIQASTRALSLIKSLVESGHRAQPP